LASNPICYRSLQFVKASFKEVTGVLYNNQARVRFPWKTRDERAQMLYLAELISIAVYEEDGLMTVLKKLKIILINGCAYAYEVAHARVSDAHRKAHA
jgi:hypothetical protein